MPVLLSPRGFYHAFSEAELTHFATCIYKDLRNCNGDPKTWWKNEWPLYQEHVRQGIRYLERDGVQHFWEWLTIIIPEPLAQQVRALEEQMEVEVIDLTRDDDVEIIDLTQDEIDDEENDNEDEDSEMSYEEDTEQGPEIIDLTKDYV